MAKGKIMPNITNNERTIRSARERERENEFWERKENSGKQKQHKLKD